ncbi:MAG: cytochrome c [Myxococcota bacterium]
MGRIRTGFIVVALLTGGLAAGCSEEAGDARSAAAGSSPSTEASAAAGSAPASPAEPATSDSGASADTRSPEALAAAGRGVYNANCIACHAMDPRIDGALGPAVAGASAELIAARVLRAEYPEGYTPKRETRVMVPLPHLEPKLPELTAYLQSLE